MREADGWLASLAPGLISVSCGGRKGLAALADDARDLRADPPAGKDWPLRLLPLWDGLLMGHKDKTWTVPDAAERPAVWRRGAHVSAAVLHRGRIVAVWTQAKRRGESIEAFRKGGRDGAGGGGSSRAEGCRGRDRDLSAVVSGTCS